MLDCRINPDSSAETRRYSRACDTAQCVLEWLEREALGVKWTMGEVDPETLCTTINGFELYCGAGITNALLYLAGSLDAAACIAARMARKW